MKNINLNKKLSVAFFWALMSSVLCLLTLLPLYFYWYPAPFSDFFSAKWIIVFSVVVQGIVSFILIALVYNPLRKDHRFNLGSIAVLQLLFLLVVIYMLGVTRPLWLVQHEDRFYTIQPVHIQSNKQTPLHYVLQSFFQKPQIQTVYFSNQPQRKQQQIEQGLAGRGLEYQPDQYQAFDARFAQSYMKEVQELEKYNKNEAINTELTTYKKQDVMWMPLNNGFADSQQDGVMILNRQGQLLGIVNLRPWN